MGIFDVFAAAKRALERHQSMDEMLFGEIVAVLVSMGWPVIYIYTPTFESSTEADTDQQEVVVRTYGDDILYSLRVILDRKTGGAASLVIGNKATLTFVAEVKNFLADPNDIIENLRTDLKNLFKIPLFGKVRLNHEFNSVFAQTTLIIDIGHWLKRKDKQALRQYLQREIKAVVDKLKSHLAKYRKPYNIRPKL